MSVTQKYFPFLAVFAGTIAYFWPHWFGDLKTWIVYLLGVVMFCMGSSLTLNDFKRAFHHHWLILLALALQFTFMPWLAWQLSELANLNPMLTMGMLLVGSVSGGTASNVMCYICKGDVALSITITAISTFLAIIATPLLVYIYANQTVEVPVLDMMKSILFIVIIPVSLGLALNQYLKIILFPIHKFGTDISIIIICLIIAIIIALNHDNLLTISPILLALVLAHNLLGLSVGFITTWLFTRDFRLCKTISIEVGMQNSGLAVALAVKFFGPAAALPGALFSVIHNITGSVLASIWLTKHKKKNI